MFSSGDRDEHHFDHPDKFDLTQNNSASIPFGAGPHFCAGAAASKCAIAEVALPTLFERLPNLALDGDAPFRGWAFRGPISMLVRWDS